MLCEKKEIINKWYKKLAFPKEYDEAFIKALKEIDLELPLNIMLYKQEKHTPIENFLAYLYYCEPLFELYQKNQIPENILLATLSDIVIWTKVWFSIKGELGLGETEWLKRHLSGRLFRLGRLQFCFGEFEKDYPCISAKKGDAVIEVHIAEDGKLSTEECDKSFMLAEQFYTTYFKDYSFKFYTCHSWLLDDGLGKYLGEKSNLSLFRQRFLVIDKDEADAIIKYVFRWDATRDNLDKFEAKTTLAKAVKQVLSNNGKFYEAFGVIDRKELLKNN